MLILRPYHLFTGMKIKIINGPNLNMLGNREPEKYGHESFESYLELLKNRFPGLEFTYFQSNIEGEIVSEIQKTVNECNGIILNAAAYTHTSVAISDAVAAVKIPVVEVHITNIFAREEFRHVSLLGRNCAGSVSGFGLDSYRLAAEALKEILEKK